MAYLLPHAIIEIEESLIDSYNLAHLHHRSISKKIPKVFNINNEELKQQIKMEYEQQTRGRLLILKISLGVLAVFGICWLINNI